MIYERVWEKSVTVVDNGWHQVPGVFPATAPFVGLATDFGVAEVTLPERNRPLTRVEAGGTCEQRCPTAGGRELLLRVLETEGLPWQGYPVKVQVWGTEEREEPA